MILTAAQPAASLTFHLPDLASVIALVVAACGLLLSAFNSGSEIAFFSLKPEVVDDIEPEPDRARIVRLLAEPERLLATILIGNNLVNIMIIIVLNFAMNQMFEFGSQLASFLVQTVILTFLILLFGEVIPKLYASSYNVVFARMVAPALEAMVRLFSPLSRLMLTSTRRVRHVARRQPDDLSTDDLSRALEASEVKNEDEKELLEGILSFGDKTVSEIMRPRIDVVDVDYDTKFGEVVAQVVRTGYSRMPVYEDTPDNIKGVLYAKDLLPYIGKRDDDFRWQNLIRPAYFVPESRMIDDLLEDFRTKKTHMAIIVDEYGCTQGIATLEDVLEEIVGDIDDEYDTEERFFQRLAPNVYVFDGKTLLSDFLRVLDLDDDALGEHAEAAETIAGLLLDIKGDFLRPNEKVAFGRFTFTVLSLDKYRIERVRVELADDPNNPQKA